MPQPIRSPIDRIVVLMLENRSFDHMLGFLPREGHLRRVEGLAGDEYNLINPFHPASDRYYVQKGAVYAWRGNTSSDGPPHTFEAANLQLSGSVSGPNPEFPPRNNGFVLGFLEMLRAQAEDPKAYWAPAEELKLVMQCFSPAQVPALSTLAREFVLCDHWFSSVPGVTMPNRFYVHAATSGGYAINDGSKKYGFKTLYNSLDEAGRPWRVYYEDVNELFLLSQVPLSRDRFRKFDASFEGDVAEGDLPSYTFIMPRWNGGRAPDGRPLHPNSEHAPDDVRDGEHLIAEVYNALRANPEIWKRCLLVVLYDEHGGFYDHVLPPPGVPNPDGINSPTPEQGPGTPRFDFRRLGFRVPAILVSPWLPRSLNTTHYEHASIPATVKRFFGLPEFLTQRDRAANSFEHLLTGEAGFREDTPETLPVPPLPPAGLLLQAAPRPIGDVERELARGVFLREPDAQRRQDLLDRLEHGLSQDEAHALLQEITERLLQLSEQPGALQ